MKNSKSEYVFDSEKSDQLENSHLPLVINSHISNIDIKNPEEIRITESIRFEVIQNTTISNLSIWLNQTLKDLKVEDELGELNSSLPDTSGNIDIELRSNFIMNQTGYLRISYYLNYELIAIGNPIYYYFQFSSKMSYLTQLFEITIRLPENTFIQKRRGYDSYTENADLLSSQNRIYLLWKSQNLEPQSIKQFFVFFGEPLQKSIPIWVLLFSPLSALICGIGSTFWLLRRKQIRDLKKIGEIYLSEDQRKLLKLIHEKGGKQIQKELVTITGLSKSKISRDLNLLEEKGFVRKQRWGKQYRVYLTETGEKVIE